LVDTGWNYVSSLAFSQDGKTLAAAGVGPGGLDVVAVFDPGGRRLPTQPEGVRPVNRPSPRRSPGAPRVRPDGPAVAFAPDDRTLAMLDRGNFLYLWELTRCLPRVAGSGVYAWPKPQLVSVSLGDRLQLAYMPSGRLIRVSSPGLITLLDTTRGDEVASTERLPLTSAAASSAVYSVGATLPVERTLATRGEAGIVLRDPANLLERWTMRTLRPFDAPLVFSADRTTMITGELNEIALWPAAPPGEPPSLIADLLRDLLDPDAEIRRNAIDATVPLGRAARAVTPELVAASSSDPDPEVRKAAAAALQTLAHGEQPLTYSERRLRRFVPPAPPR
jgi:hypothetical protein